MAYGSRSGMETVFGTNRIATLADADETSDSGEITAAITAALAYADARIDARLRRTHYRLPIADGDGDTPPLVVKIADRLAAGWLARQWRLESVPPDDTGERVLQYEREALSELDMIANGALRLDAI